MKIDYATFKHGLCLISISVYIYLFIIYIYTTDTFGHRSSEYLKYSVTYTISPPRLSLFKDYLFTYNTKNYNT